MTTPAKTTVELPAWVVGELLAEVDLFEKHGQALCYCATPHYECPPCAAYRIADKALTDAS